MTINVQNFYTLFIWAIFSLSLLSTPAIAATSEERLPLWEIGIGVAPITMPSYRGAKTQEFYPVPLPYVDYRGDFLRIDREGIRGLLYDSDRLQLDFSGDGAIPSTTDEDGPRRGMPDLDPLVEFGPSLNFIIHESARSRLRLRMPVRIALASDFSAVYHVGWTANPHVGADFRKAVRGWNLGLSLGPLFADAGYHGFYYNVEDRFVIAGFRERYKAGGGYSGTSIMVTTSRRFKNFWTGMFVRYDNLSGAVFTDSPLVETRHSFMAGFGIAWIFHKSQETVSPTREDFY